MPSVPPSDTASTHPGTDPSGASDPGALVGRFLGPYLIVRHLASGGMGAVYLADHPALRRQVAVKVLTADPSADPHALERFRREARAAAALDHPHIVRLFDIGHAEGVHFLVLEYVEGTDLQTLIDRDGPVPYPQAVALVAQAAAGLQHAHERGFVHRDVKPANLIRTPEGAVKVLDMGLAWSVREHPADRLTLHGPGESIVGTADYLSPEQALNAPLDPRTDVYSLGVTLYALLAGRPPFAGTTLQKLSQVQFKEPPRLDVRFGARVPAELADVVARMTAKRPGDRYPSAADVIAALAPWLPPDLLAALGSDARTRESLSKLLPAARRRRRALVVISAAVVVAATALGAYLRPGDPAPDVPVPDPSAQVLVLDGHRNKVNDLVFSPDGTRLISIDTSGWLLVWDAQTGALLHTAPRAGPAAKFWACAGAPDGRVFAAGQGQPILAFDGATGAKVREYDSHIGVVTGLAVSPDGRHLAVSGVHGDVALLDSSTGAEVRRFPTGAGLVWAVAFSPDGSELAAATGEGGEPEGVNRVVVWGAADGEVRHRFAGHTAPVRSVAFHPDRRVLASGGFDGTVRLWSLDTGEPVRHWTAHDGYVERVCFLPGGARLVTCGGPGPEDAPRAGAGAGAVWDADTGRPVTVWRGPEWNGLVSLAVSPDGRFLAAGGRDRGGRLWPVTLAP